MSEKIDLLDFGALTKEHKKVAEEIIKMADEMGLPMLSELIKQKFKIVDIPVYDFSKTKFAEKLKENNINLLVQGYNLENGVKYPIVAICEDIRKLEKLIE
jgi:hypothetical protein